LLAAFGLAYHNRPNGSASEIRSAVDFEGRTIWIVDAHRDDGKRLVVHADEKLTAFMELEAAICVCEEFS
jgi:hypothetical protein